MRAVPALIALVLLAACGKGNEDVGGVTPEEDRLLNEAAASQDANLTSQPIGNAEAAPQGNAQ